MFKNMHRNKRQRSENWLDEDKILLKKLVRERVHAIENKKTDTNSNTRKVAAWLDIKESFNFVCKGSPRTVMQLKGQWGLIKIKEKRRIAEERKEMLRTGRDSPVIEAISNEDISIWLPNNEFTTNDNKFDSDSIMDDIKNGTATNIQEVITNENSVEPQAPALPAPSTSQLLDPLTPSGSQMLGPKPRRIRKQIHSPVSPAEQVAACETKCRRELHMIQVNNEKLKFENLKLEQELLRYKIEYYRKKID